MDTHTRLHCYFSIHCARIKTQIFYVSDPLSVTKKKMSRNLQPFVLKTLIFSNFTDLFSPAYDNFIQ